MTHNHPVVGSSPTQPTNIFLWIGLLGGTCKFRCTCSTQYFYAQYLGLFILLFYDSFVFATDLPDQGQRTVYPSYDLLQLASTRHAQIISLSFLQ